MALATMILARDATVAECLCGIVCILAVLGQSGYNLVRLRQKNWISA